MPFSFGATTQLLNEVFEYDTFATDSMRNLFNPDVVTARELIVDQLASAMGRDPYEFRREFLAEDRARAVLDKAAEVGRWGREMEPGTAQGISMHEEYKGVVAAVVELDNPGGAGEFGVPVSMAAVACAYTRATGRCRPASRSTTTPSASPPSRPSRRSPSRPPTA